MRTTFAKLLPGSISRSAMMWLIRCRLIDLVQEKLKLLLALPI